MCNLFSLLVVCKNVLLHVDRAVDRSLGTLHCSRLPHIAARCDAIKAQE